jgi:hypothetical protein
VAEADIPADTLVAEADILEAEATAADIDFSLAKISEALYHKVSS